MRPMRNSISLMLIVSILFTFCICPAAFAIDNAKNNKNKETNQQDVSMQIKQIQENDKKCSAIINEMEEYLTRNSDGTLSLEIPKDIKYDKEVVKGLEKGLQNTNKLIKQGVLQSDDKLNIYYKNSKSNEVIVSAASGGVTKVLFYWWGYKIYLKHSDVKDIAAGCNIAAALALWIPDPTICKAICSVLIVAGTTLAYYDEGNGVVVRVTTITGPPIVTGVWSQ